MEWKLNGKTEKCVTPSTVELVECDLLGNFS